MGAPTPDLDAARVAVARHASRTPLVPARDLSERLGRPVLLKLECLQRTGSFKVRGAAARLEALTPAERARGVVACSSGNHGRAVAFVAGRMGVPATVFVPEWVDPVKLEGIVAAGADARREGVTFDESEALATAYAANRGLTYVSAYDDPWVIAGQGTIAGEIAEQAHDGVAVVVVPLSGGGLVGGIAAAFRDAQAAGVGSRPEIVAVSAERAAVMLASVRAGRPVDLPEEETLASALAGGIGLDNQYSYPMVRDLVDVHVTVSEEEIAGAMRYAVERLRVVVEGGGAVGLAALLAEAAGRDVASEGDAEAASRPAADRRGPAEGAIVVVVSGGNVATETLLKVLAEAG
jgi:threonine dehydratase